MSTLLLAFHRVRNRVLPRADYKAHLQLSGPEVKLLDEVAPFYPTRNAAMRTALALLHAAHAEAKQAEGQP